VGRLSDIAGLPVVCLDSGKRAGTVKGPVFTPTGNAVAGFFISTGFPGSPGGIVFIEDILDIGRDALLIFDENSVEKRRKVLKKFMRDEKWSCMNKKVMTKDGEELGVVKDGVIDAKTGRIVEVELSRGLLEDLRVGRRILRLGLDAEFGEDYIIISKGGGINEEKSS